MLKLIHAYVRTCIHTCRHVHVPNMEIPIHKHSVHAYDSYICTQITKHMIHTYVYTHVKHKHSCVCMSPDVHADAASPPQTRLTVSCGTYPIARLNDLMLTWRKSQPSNKMRPGRGEGGEGAHIIRPPQSPRQHGYMWLFPHLGLGRGV